MEVRQPIRVGREPMCPIWCDRSGCGFCAMKREKKTISQGNYSYCRLSAEGGMTHGSRPDDPNSPSRPARPGPLTDPPTGRPEWRWSCMKKSPRVGTSEGSSTILFLYSSSSLRRLSPGDWEGRPMSELTMTGAMTIEPVRRWLAVVSVGTAATSL